MTRPTFGKDRDPGVVEDLATIREDGRRHRRSRAATSNPLLAVYGPGPDGAKCGTCVHIFAWGDVAGRYYKCELRRVSRSVVTDHRVRWPACGRYEKETDDG